MKRRLTYLLFLIPVAALAIPFLLPIRNGQPLLDWHDLFMTHANNDALPMHSASPHEPVMLYRWQDENQRWYFSQTPPEGRPYDTIFVDPDRSLVSAPASVSSSTQAASNDSSTSPSPYSPGEIAQALQEARNAQALLLKRQEQQEAELNGQQTDK